MVRPETAPSRHVKIKLRCIKGIACQGQLETGGKEVGTCQLDG